MDRINRGRRYVIKKEHRGRGGVGEAGRWQGGSQRWGKPVDYSVIGIKGWVFKK